MHENSISITDFSKLDLRIKVMLIMVLCNSLTYVALHVASLTNACIAHVWNTQSHVYITTQQLAGDNEYILCVYVTHILRISHSQDVHGNQPMHGIKMFFEIF